MAISKFPCPVTFPRTVFLCSWNVFPTVSRYRYVKWFWRFPNIFYPIYYSSVSDPRFQCGSGIRVRIQLFTSMWTQIRFRIQAAKLMRIQILVRLCCYKKFVLTWKIYFICPKRPDWKAGNQVYLLILVNFLAPGSGSTFPIRTWIQEIQINANPDRNTVLFCQIVKTFPRILFVKLFWIFTRCYCANNFLWDYSGVFPQKYRTCICLNMPEFFLYSQPHSDVINFLFGKILRQFPSLSMKFISLFLSNMSNNVFN
jgi:hypothetical protein